MNTAKLSDAQSDQLRADLRAGEKNKTLAKKYGITEQSISYHRARLDKPPPVAMNQVSIEHLPTIRAMRAQRMTRTQIARALNATLQSVLNICPQAGKRNGRS